MCSAEAQAAQAHFLVLLGSRYRIRYHDMSAETPGAASLCIQYALTFLSRQKFCRARRTRFRLSPCHSTPEAIPKIFSIFQK